MPSLSVAERRDLSCAWVELHKVAQGSEAHAGLFWAYLKLDGLIRSDPDEAWLTILEILKIGEDEWTIANLGAGPLEDLLVYHGPQIIDLVEAHAAEPHVAQLAQHVWKNAIPDEVWLRLQSVAMRTRQDVSF